MDVAMSPAAPLPDETDMEKEVDRIQKTAEKQLASVHGLNVSLVKKIRKSEAQTASLLHQNKTLEDKNADLVTQLHRAQDDVRTLTLKKMKLAEVEAKLDSTSSALVASELEVKNVEARLDEITAERDTLASEADTLRRHADDVDGQLKMAHEDAEKQRQEWQQDVEARSLELAAVAKERDEKEHTRSQLEETVKSRDLDIEDASAKLLASEEGRQRAVEEAEQKTRETEEQLAESNAKVLALDEELAVIGGERKRLVEQKDDLEASVATLTKERDELLESVESTTKDVETAKAELETVEKERDDIKSDLDNKIVEATELAAKVAALGEERDELVKHRDELEGVIENSRKEADEKKTELETRDLDLNKIEGERNLLADEKMTLEKDFADARDRATLLEREKTLLEKRVVDLEENEKRLGVAIQVLEKEREDMRLAHEEELRERISEKEREFALDTAELRRELDDVVDRHASMRRAEMGRDLASPKSAADPVEEDSHEPEEIVDVEHERDLSAIGPDVPTDMPTEPTSSYEPLDEKPAEDGTAVMVRVEEPEQGPAEGDTSDVVLREEVVVDRDMEDHNAVEEVEDEVPASSAEVEAAIGGGTATGDIYGSPDLKEDEDTESKDVSGYDDAVDNMEEAPQVAGEGMENIAKPVVDGVASAATTTVDTAGKAVDATREAASNVAAKTKKANFFACCVRPNTDGGARGAPNS